MVKRLLPLLRRLRRRWTRRKEKLGQVKISKAALISSRTATARRGVLVLARKAAKKEKKKEKAKGMSIPGFRCEARYRKETYKKWND